MRAGVKVSVSWTNSPHAILISGLFFRGDRYVSFANTLRAASIVNAMSLSVWVEAMCARLIEARLINVVLFILIPIFSGS